MIRFAALAFALALLPVVPARAEEAEAPIPTAEGATAPAAPEELLEVAETRTAAETPSVIPVPRPEIPSVDSAEIELAVIDPDPEPPQQEIVTRATSTGTRLYGVSLGRHPSRNAAERLLLQTALTELSTFGEALRNVVNRPGGFEAQFAGMSEEAAERACARLMSRNVTCTTYGP